MSLDPTATTPTGQDTSDPAPLVLTDIAAPVTAAPVTAATVTAAPVTAREIADLLRHLTELRTSGGEADPDARAEFLARKTELFARIAADPSTPAGAPAPGRRNP